jgi:hypothetical protein
MGDVAIGSSLIVRSKERNCHRRGFRISGGSRETFLNAPSQRCDNGVPFASPNALFNLSKLSVWWLRLGIATERIKLGHPQQNGRHERMHLTPKKATRPPGFNSLQQQDRFDAFVQDFVEPPALLAFGSLANGPPSVIT